MGRSTVHYVDNDTNNILKQLHNKLRPAGTPVQRVEYIIELLLLRIFEVKVKHDDEFKELRKLFEGEHYRLLFSYLQTLSGNKILVELNQNFFPFYANILTKVREISSANLNQKVQDYLVLIEEVFANSNFTNNVVGGMMHTIISLVSEIDEERILKTDLLGDAIESSLSETGGTQDVGLYRTPDHVRQMMTAMVDPDFKDRIFDPTCGTGGFLFDAFQYVLEKVTHRGTWPGKKAHHELEEFFTQHLRTSKSAMPTQDEANAFYREGISGVEYLGMIRKMAAINLFIRGLNPANIRQGDSLQMYDPATEKASKTAILANPPFGAERDQDAYPNVWEAYSKESETTILFVKLMFEYLKAGGRCAVVVSEGFLTWDKASARALRKALLEEANLRAVISMPQGVFVSKQGQGAKTSILYFEKGAPTDWVWYYKVENDGYSMGTNRQQIDDSQLPELLTLFTRDVKQGRIPPETDHCFAIPVEWITTLDPRSKAAIRRETREKRRERDERTRRKKIEQLERQRAKGKIDDAAYQKQLRQFDELLEIQTQNEIAKNIEKAHLYSLNLGSYRSNLNAQQLEEWRQALVGRVEPSQKSLDERYQVLQQANPETALNILASFDPRNALDIDIVRQYLHELDENVLQNEPIFKKFDEILRQGLQYPNIKLEYLLTPKYEKIKKDEYQGNDEIISKISFSDGKIHFRAEKTTGMDLYKAEQGDVITSKINVHQGAVAIAPCDLVCSTHYQVYSVRKDDVLSSYLVHVLRTPKFKEKLAQEKNKGIKNEQGAKFLFQFAIPLPSLDIQRELVEKIESQQQIIEAVKTITTNWNISIEVNDSCPLSPLGTAVLNTQNGWSPRCDGGELAVLTLSALKNGRIDFNEVKYTNLTRDDMDKFLVKEGDFFYSRGNTKELVALAAIAYNSPENIIFSDLFTKVQFDENKILPKFAVYLFNSNIGRAYFAKVPEGSSPTMVKVSQDYMKNFMVPYLEKIDIQHQIVKQLDKEMAALEQVRFLKTQAERRIEQLLNEIWGE